VPRTVERQHGDLLFHAELRRRHRLGRHGRLGLVDHGRARFELLDRLVVAAAPLLRLNHPRCDPELPHVEIAVCLQQDAG
jgi:hypothetical protein